MESPSDVELVWGTEGALLDGKPWPMEGRGRIRLPAGAHTIENAARREGIVVTDLNASLKAAAVEGKRVAFEYTSESRALVQFDRRPQAIEIDGSAFPGTCVDRSNCALLLPKGSHRVVAN
jgi:hypothetical protein